MYKEIKVNNLSEMEQIAKTVGKHVFKGFVLCLQGDLGAGKTTFTKFLGKSIGIADTINSPTFTILKIYENTLDLFHIDAYRLRGIGADYSLEDYIYGEGLCVIEWYKHIIESIPNDKLVIEIKHLGDTKRLLKIWGDNQYEKIVEAINN
ncbi:MAG: tRNA (adenosine(37)-N6)-threonylcarbamoyltransferase complex ATPase subunit type 1 TsaE [Candidatus Izimaplasma sp.]|nr:tRNA (adenosine(37)-N6)-threonylcarbamoyltransferase complex ATPase subunit type 1 TsaE [Candidatus Izimaplasma bacterium]